MTILFVIGHSNRPSDDSKALIPRGTVIASPVQEGETVSFQLSHSIISEVDTKPAKLYQQKIPNYILSAANNDAEMAWFAELQNIPCERGKVVLCGLDFPHGTRLCDAIKPCSGVHTCRGILGLFPEYKMIWLLNCRGTQSPAHELPGEKVAYDEALTFMKLPYAERKRRWQSDEMTDNDRLRLLASPSVSTFRDALSIENYAESEKGRFSGYRALLSQRAGIGDESYESLVRHVDSLAGDGVQWAKDIVFARDLFEYWSGIQTDREVEGRFSDDWQRFDAVNREQIIAIDAGYFGGKLNAHFRGTLSKDNPLAPAAEKGQSQKSFPQAEVADRITAAAIKSLGPEDFDTFTFYYSASDDSLIMERGNQNNFGDLKGPAVASGTIQAIPLEGIPYFELPTDKSLSDVFKRVFQRIRDSGDVAFDWSGT